MATVTTQHVEQLMKRCQIGVGGRGALDAAHDIMAECYGTLGALVKERDRLRMMLDGRPAINAGLPETYIEWSQGIYAADYAHAVGHDG